MDELSDEEIKSLHRAIQLRYGIDFTNYETVSLKRRVARVISKFNLESLVGLWSRMLKDSQFIYTYIDELTVGLTEMFRNPDLWLKITDELKVLQHQPTVKIWHAGCSTGEEVYTMAIILEELKMKARTFTLATDLNSQYIKTAQAGIYSANTIHSYAKNFEAYQKERTIKKPLKDLFEPYIEPYIEPIEVARGNNLQIKSAYKRNITFETQNLTKPFLTADKFDIIFCRNVMIYFDEVLKQKVLHTFYDSLKPNGLFIIGYYDALPADNAQLFEMYQPAFKMLRRID